MTLRPAPGLIRFALLAAFVAGLFALAACNKEPVEAIPHEYDPADPNRPTIFGPGGIDLFGGKKREDDGGGGIGVNSFLWRASLDTLAFMPITSADALGGVILTDWYTFADSPNERFKLNVYILGRALRADGVRVSSFRQTRDPSGTWRDAAVPKETAIKIEESILTRARQLRQETMAQRSR